MYFKQNHIKKWEFALLLALCFTVLSGAWAAAGQRELSGKLIRLHVIAVSDTERDQAAKLRARDAILELLEPELLGIESRAEAEERIAVLLPAIEEAARGAAETASGSELGVAATLGREAYPTRYYDGFALPAGEYLSLRVVLGEGQGKNWWCVVFPPLCAAAAEGVAGVSGTGVLDDEDVALISEGDGYEIRFKILEIWGSVRNFMEEKFNAG